MATVFVGEALLQNEGLLLPDVHNFFIKEFIAYAPAGTEQCFTARWVLNNLTVSLQQHLSKVRKCGTLLYRSNGDILVILTNALYKISKATHSNEGERHEEDSKRETQHKCHASSG